MQGLIENALIPVQVGVIKVVVLTVFKCWLVIPMGYEPASVTIRFRGSSVLSF